MIAEQSAGIEEGDAHRALRRHGAADVEHDSRDARLFQCGEDGLGLGHGGGVDDQGKLHDHGVHAGVGGGEGTGVEEVGGDRLRAGREVAGMAGDGAHGMSGCHEVAHHRGALGAGSAMDGDVGHGRKLVPDVN